MSQTDSSTDRQTQAKQYERIHNWLFVVDLIVTLALLLAFLFSGLSAWLAGVCRNLTANPWIHVTLYIAAIVLAQTILLLPLSWYSGFHLEHKFALSNETLAGWIKDKLKSLGLNLVLG